MILNDSTMQEKECNLKLTHKGQSRFDQIMEKLDQLKESINSRIDNLIKMNHLIE